MALKRFTVLNRSLKKNSGPAQYSILAETGVGKSGGNLITRIVDNPFPLNATTPTGNQKKIYGLPPRGSGIDGPAALVSIEIKPQPFAYVYGPQVIRRGGQSYPTTIQRSFPVRIIRPGQ